MAKPVKRSDLVGVWQMAAIGGMVQSFELRADGKAKQSIQLPDGQTLKQAGKWKFDGDRKWTVMLPREEIEYDVVKLGPKKMECTNWDDDAIAISFKKVK